MKIDGTSQPALYEGFVMKMLRPRMILLGGLILISVCAFCFFPREWVRAGEHGNSIPSPIPPGWITIMREDFEESFPGAWNVFDYDGSDNGEFYWGKRNCRSYAGDFSGWAVGAGPDGAALSCGSNYPDNVNTWMIYGPFDLSDAAAAELRFKYWLDSAAGTDIFSWGASITGTHFYIYSVTGNSGGWKDQAMDLSNIHTIGNLLGEPQVWIALTFISDESINLPEGIYVDDIHLRKVLMRENNQYLPFVAK